MAKKRTPSHSEHYLHSALCWFQLLGIGWVVNSVKPAISLLTGVMSLALSVIFVRLLQQNVSWQRRINLAKCRSRSGWDIKQVPPVWHLFSITSPLSGYDILQPVNELMLFFVVPWTMMSLTFYKWIWVWMSQIGWPYGVFNFFPLRTRRQGLLMLKGRAHQVLWLFYN